MAHLGTLMAAMGTADMVTRTVATAVTVDTVPHSVVMVMGATVTPATERVR